MNRNLVGSIYMYGRFCIKFPQSRMKGERHRFSPLSLQFLIVVVVNVIFSLFKFYKQWAYETIVFKAKHIFLLCSLSFIFQQISVIVQTNCSSFTLVSTNFAARLQYIYIFICKTQIDLQPLIHVRYLRHRHLYLRSMSFLQILKSMSFSNSQIGIQFSNLRPFLTFSN